MPLPRPLSATVRTTFWFVLCWTISLAVTQSVLSSGPVGWGEKLVVLASGALVGLVSAWFELRASPIITRRYSVGMMVLLRSLFYLTALATIVHVFTFPLFGLVDGEGVFGFLRSDRYARFLTDGRFLSGIGALTLAVS